MPVRSRRPYAAIALFALAALIALPAQAEMTEADRVGMRAFAACVAEDDGSVATCIARLSLYAWYPRDHDNCSKIGAGVDKIIALDGQPKWINLFRNERCARLGMPHGAVAARAGGRWDPNEGYAQCSEFGPGGISCEDEIGRHAWHPYDEGDCPGSGLEAQREHRSRVGGQYIWRMLFETERCRRLGLPYLTPEVVQ